GWRGRPGTQRLRPRELRALPSDAILWIERWRPNGARSSRGRSPCVPGPFEGDSRLVAGTPGERQFVTVKRTAFEVPRPLVMVTGPDWASWGTMTLIWFSL